MYITWRPATWNDIEPALSLQPENRGDCIVGVKAALPAWSRMFHHPFFFSAVLETAPLGQGRRMVGFGSSIFVSSGFAEAEVAHPRPDLTSRIIASFSSANSVLASPAEIAHCNAANGVSVVILYNTWHDSTLSPEERDEVRTLLPASLAECLAGFRIRQILAETTSPLLTEFYQTSVVWRTIGEFPDRARASHLMTAESVRPIGGSLGNLIFRFREPVLRLRDSDQQLLLATLDGATDQELTHKLGITFAAVKARWRSIFERISETQPGLLSEIGDRDGRGSQKRHRVIAYVRNHPEELRPYDWKTTKRLNHQTAQSGQAT